MSSTPPPATSAGPAWLAGSKELFTPQEYYENLAAGTRATDREEAPLKPPTRPGPRILIVDDEPDIVDALRETMETALPDAQVFGARNGLQGLTVLGKEPIDLIITDFKMPVMDGLEFLARAERIAPETPQILMTAFVMDLPSSASRHVPKERFVSKPFAPETMTACVRAALAQAR